MTGKVFVYGSLMTGFFNYEKILKSRVIKRETAYVVGTLYHLKDKGYPGFIRQGDTKVFGEILTIQDFKETQEAMDILEGYHGELSSENDYNRQLLPVINESTGCEEHLDVYVYNMKAFNNHMDERILINHGSWKLFMEELNSKIS